MNIVDENWHQTKAREKKKCETKKNSFNANAVFHRVYLSLVFAFVRYVWCRRKRHVHINRVIEQKREINWRNMKNDETKRRIRKFTCQFSSRRKRRRRRPRRSTNKEISKWFIRSSKNGLIRGFPSSSTIVFYYFTVHCY